MASITSNSIPSVSGDGILKTPNAINNTPQFVEDNLGNLSALQLSDDLVIAESGEQCPLKVFSTGAGGGISLNDSTTSDTEQVGVGAFGDLLCLRGGGNAAGTIRISGTGADFKGNFIKNFIPSIASLSTTITIDENNEDTYCGQVIQVTGAVTITFPSVLGVRNGFNCSIIQLDANQTTIAVTGALNIRNRQGHNKNNGQYSIITILKNSTNVFLGGDTA